MNEGMLLRRAPVRSHSCRGRKRHDRRVSPGHDDKHEHRCDPHPKRKHKETDDKHRHNGDKAKHRNDHRHRHHVSQNRGPYASSTLSSQHSDTHTHKKHDQKHGKVHASVPDPTTGSGDKGKSGTQGPQSKQPQQPVGSTQKDSPPATRQPTPALLKAGKAGVITTFQGTMQGPATFYATADDGRGNCLLPVREDNMFAAINDLAWAGSAQCGMCVRVETLDGSKSTTVMITNREPEPVEGAIDLSLEAFTALAREEVGRLAVNWTPVDCVKAGLVTSQSPSVVWKNGSTEYWFGLQVRESALPLAQVSIRITSPGNTTSTPLDPGFSPWSLLNRTDYNFWLASSGIEDGKGGKSVGPFDIKVQYQDESEILFPAIKLNSEVLKQV
ncbi:hypothetical protein MVLG_06891 [Microbotryum lychnidis-dioicae p1A1 Lamole]|uniref:Expansin-like EG45 domain-containing protein n=1 Tax=Microbotryum lychnidis-dioicae (strain p1A1 Lamole / MvSl-1064) TaxID=683840 RepID=U5HIP1_USTV1|nr:hypothetical protein MVLG_06891 [Microbotryum lychnidis-dioicae p1A1 Lamole]|eukprot:KDE02556.1 hypothetical protein MVLG_06891 [Microbotryum lychnidis-dioicae p1A1 Lamole]